MAGAGKRGHELTSFMHGEKFLDQLRKYVPIILHVTTCSK